MQLAVGQQEATSLHRGRLAAEQWPLAIGAGDRNRWVDRVQARERLSGCAGMVAQAFVSALFPWTHAHAYGDISLSLGWPAFVGQ